MATGPQDVPRTVLVFVAIALALAACSGAAEDARSGEGPATSLDRCPPRPEGGTDEYDDPYADLPASVPDGAVAAQLCEGGGSGMELPADVLTTDVADLVDVVNDQPEQGGHDCTADAGPGYRLMFNYDDGSTFLISAGFYGCGSVVVGSVYREGPAVVLQTFQDLVVAQRAQQVPPSPPVPGDLTCEGRDAVPDVPPIGLPQDAVRAVLCRVKSRDRVVYYSAPIGRDDVRVLLDDLAARSDPGPVHCAEKPPYSWIVATTAWGDRVEIGGECRPGQWRLPNDMVWTPGPQAVEILDQLVSEARRDR